MTQDPPKFRIGSVQYLNAVPLTRGIEGGVILPRPPVSPKCFGATGEHEIFDPGFAWLELTNLPFVYAVWALRFL